MNAPVSSSNLPLNPLIEVLGHSDAGDGARTTSLQPIGDFIQHLLGVAGIGQLFTAVAALQAAAGSGFNASTVAALIRGARNSPDGRYLQIQDAAGNWISFFDLTVLTGPIQELQGLAATQLRVSEDGKFLQWKRKDSAWFNFFDLAVLTQPIAALGNRLDSHDARLLALGLTEAGFSAAISAIQALDPAYRAPYRKIEPIGALVLEDGLVLIPKLRRRNADGTITIISPPNGEAYWQFGISDNDYTNPVVYYLNMPAGSVQADDNAAAQANIGDALRPAIAYSANGAIHTPYARAITRPNEFGFNVTGRPSILGDGTYPVAVSDPTLNGFNIYRGFQHPTGRPFIGGLIPRPLIAQRFFARVWIISDADNDFPPVQIYVRGEGTATFPRDPMVLERQWSPRLASYIRSVDTIPLDQSPAGLCVQLEPGTNRPGLVLAGFQFATGSERNLYVLRNDNPYASGAEATRLQTLDGAKPTEILFGDRICLIEGRPQTLFPDSLTLDRDHVAPVLTFASDGGAEAEKPPVVVTSRASIPLDPARLAHGRSFTLVRSRPFPFASEPQYQEGTVRIAPKATLAGAAPKILLLGDSFLEGYVFRQLRQVLVACGANPTFLGTMYGDQDGGLYRREGRSGSALADLVNKNTDFLEPVTDVPAYLAGSNAYRAGLNPFATNGTGPKSYNGQEFSFAHYLETYGVEVPDFVVMHYGRNDVGDHPSASALNAWMKTALGIVVPSIRAAGGGNIKLILAVSNAGADNIQDQIWENLYAPGVIKGTMGYVRALADPMVRFAGAFAHQSQHAFNSFTPVSTDPDTGVRLRGNVADDVHSGLLVAAQQFGECVAAHIADML